MKKPKVLIVDDEEEIRNALESLLTKAYTVEVAENGIMALKKVFKNRPDIILTDLRMPEMDGFQLCKALRDDDEFSGVPILIISALNDVSEKTRLFEAGADDYVNKPFDTAELLARIQRNLARVNNKNKNLTSSPNIMKKFFSGIEVELDTQLQEIKIGLDSISLSAIESKLLYCLVKYDNELVPREKIIEFVWEKQVVSPRLIDPHILSLRNKLSAYYLTIQSVYGKGYILKSVAH